MKNVVICGSQLKQVEAYADSIYACQIDGATLNCGVIDTPDTIFDKHTPKNKNAVFVHIKAFSLNYRDKNFIFSMLKKNAENGYFAIGSDFAGEVIETGSEVRTLSVGDTVIGNNHYRGVEFGANHMTQGIPSSHAGKEYHVFQESRLIKIPDNISTVTAAAFSVCAQTAYSIVRKLNIKAGGNILITAARSNTSLFVLNALRQYPVNITMTTTSTGYEQQIKAMGAKEVIQIDPTLDSLARNEALSAIAMQMGRFQGVVDPFYDLHLDKVTDLMAPGGKYITCGLHEQHPDMIGQTSAKLESNLNKVMMAAIFNNLEIIGNCLGQTEDLVAAVEDHANGLFNVAVDCVFTGQEVVAFIDRTYNAQDRLGKVVFAFN